MKTIDISTYRITAMAHELGSTATTVRGIVRFMRGCPRRQHNRLGCRRTWDYCPRPSYIQAEREARRAADDLQFRNGWKRGIIRELRAVCNPPQRTLAEVTAAAESRDKRQTQLKKIMALAATGAYRPRRTPALAPLAGALLLGKKRDVAALARKFGAQIIMRGADARSICTRRNSKHVYEPGETEWKNGNPKAYTRAKHDNYIRSFAMIRDPQTIDVVIHTHEYSVSLPHGFAWDVDENGLRAFQVGSRRDDYHPDACELYNGIDFVAAIERNRETRLRLMAEIAAEAAPDTTVCLADSVRAGNCRQGSLSWCERVGLNPERHYTSAEIVAAGANGGDFGRARLAIAAAARREREEMARGYALLSEHTA